MSRRMLDIEPEQRALDRGNEPAPSAWARLGAQLRARRALLPLLVLAGCLALAAALLATGPKAARAPRPKQARLVEVTPAEVRSERTVVEAMGMAMPAREIALESEVAGRVVEVSPDFAPGGRFAEGAVMLRLDPRDYELTVRQRESDLARARAGLQLEQGNQSIARQEFEVLGEAIRDEDRDLVLRKPQLDSAQAMVAAAEAALGEARLALGRATLRAPFDAMVRMRAVELGARVAPGAPVATLVDTSAYWVELSLPVSQLRFVSLPGPKGEPGSPVRISDPSAWGPGVAREGRVIRLLGDIEPEGRMARLLVEVPDPLALLPENAGEPALLVGAYVRGEIEGAPLDGVVSLDRALLRDGDRVWVMNEKHELEIRQVEVTFRGNEHVLVSSGLAPGERIVVSELSAPVEGMLLRTADEPAEAPAP